MFEGLTHVLELDDAVEEFDMKAVFVKVEEIIRQPRRNEANGNHLDQHLPVSFVVPVPCRWRRGVKKRREEF